QVERRRPVWWLGARHVSNRLGHSLGEVKCEFAEQSPLRERRRESLDGDLGIASESEGVRQKSTQFPSQARSRRNALADLVRPAEQLHGDACRNISPEGLL